MKPNILLVSMPWGLLTEPCLGLSILQAKLDEARIGSEVVYANVWLLRWLRPETYEAVADAWGTNDFIFTGILDPAIDQKQIDAIHASIPQFRKTSRYWDELGSDRQIAEYLIRIRTEAIPPYIDQCAKSILARRPTLVGLTCLFDQTFPSVAVAHRLKELDPDVPVVLGGYAVDGETGLHLLDAFPWVDAIHQGDGEEAIVPLAYASIGAAPWSEVPGLIRREEKCAPRTKVSMDASPVPQYRDFFRSVDALQTEDHIRINNLVLSMETSRGCWWGQKNHCVFCGIDDETMRYRHRSPENVMAILRELRQRHGEKVIRFADYILPHEYHNTLIPELVAERPRFQLACEMKANATYEMLENMTDAGFLEIQPGIESFDSDVLKAMRKGVTAIRNIAYLKAARILGLKIHYNVLYGFPFDELSSYLKQIQLIPCLSHMEAPISNINVLTTRYAPLQQDPVRFGLAPGNNAHWRYDVMFSKDFTERTGFDATRYAYYFANRYRNSQELRRCYRIIDFQVNNWRDRVEQGRPAKLTFIREARRVCDSRFSTEPQQISLNEDQIEILCETNFDIVKLCDLETTLGKDKVARSLPVLIDKRLVYVEQGKIIGLPIWIENDVPIRRQRSLGNAPRVPRASVPDAARCSSRPQDLVQLAAAPIKRIDI